MYLAQRTFRCILHGPELYEKFHHKHLRSSFPRQKQLARHFLNWKLERLFTFKTFGSPYIAQRYWPQKARAWGMKRRHAFAHHRSGWNVFLALDCLNHNEHCRKSRSQWLAWNIKYKYDIKNSVSSTLPNLL